MSDYFARLVSRVHGTTPRVLPRVPSFYAPVGAEREPFAAVDLEAEAAASPASIGPQMKSAMSASRAEVHEAGLRVAPRAAPALPVEPSPLAQTELLRAPSAEAVEVDLPPPRSLAPEPAAEPDRARSRELARSREPAPERPKAPTKRGVMSVEPRAHEEDLPGEPRRRARPPAPPADEVAATPRRRAVSERASTADPARSEPRTETSPHGEPRRRDHASPLPATEEERIAPRRSTPAEPASRAPRRDEEVYVERSTSAPIEPGQSGFVRREPTAESIVRVTIGRVDVRAVLTPPATSGRARDREAKAPPALSLDDYLKRRSGGQR